MKMEACRQQTCETSSIDGGEFRKQNPGELSDAALLICMYIGSIGGSVGGCLITKYFFCGVYPTAFGMFGCMMGTFTICSIASFWMAAFPLNKHTIHESRLSVPEGGESQASVGAVELDNAKLRVIRTSCKDSPSGSSSTERSPSTKPRER
jgi:hypothetical protein